MTSLSINNEISYNNSEQQGGINNFSFSSFFAKFIPNKLSKKNADEKLFNRYCKSHKYYPVILPKRNRIIAIGDLHGDFDLTIRSLKLAEVIDDNNNWIGRDTVVVQVGDQLDSRRDNTDPASSYSDNTPEDIRVLEFMTELNAKAMDKGGFVISLLGNHEIMNVLGDMRYVSKKDLRDTRKEDFKQGNKYAKLMACTRVPAVIIGSFIFVHAGLINEFLKIVNVKERNDLYRISYIMRKWLLGIIDKDNVGNIIAAHKESLFWDRILGSIPPNMSNEHEKCADYLDDVLELFQVNKMVIGHTPQYFINKEGINKTCDDRLWRVDIGASFGFNNFDKDFVHTHKVNELRNAQVLEILDDKIINILKE